MFEDSLVESTGRIRTRSGKLAAGSFLLQAAFLAVLILIPYLYPDALPRQALTMLLVAPPPPPAPATLPEHAAPARAVTAVPLASLSMPSRIPTHAAIQAVDNPAPTNIGMGLESSVPPGSGALRGLFPSSTASAPRVVAASKLESGPIRVSAGVAAGRLLVSIRPIYPAIAKSAHIQGTVVVEATISKTGTVENARAISGPSMLVQAAIAAIAQARYQPYKLNGEPVEVETTINIVFTLSE
jgi:protein TonB